MRFISLFALYLGCSLLSLAEELNYEFQEGSESNHRSSMIAAEAQQGVKNISSSLASEEDKPQWNKRDKVWGLGTVFKGSFSEVGLMAISSEATTILSDPLIIKDSQEKEEANTVTKSSIFNSLVIQKTNIEEAV
jgi:hypothetical protein